MKKMLRRMIVMAMIAIITVSSVFGFTQTTQAAVYSDLNYYLVFNAEYYYTHNPDVAAVYGDNEQALYMHFLKYGMKEGRIANESFNVQVYKDSNPDLQAAFGDNYTAYYNHYLRYGLYENRKINSYIYNGVDYSAVFDPQYYYDNNPDVAAAIGYNPTKLWEHFTQYGMNEGRRASYYFDVNAYKNNYPDLVQAFGNDLASYYKHYVQSGASEGRLSTESDTVYQGVDYSAVYNKAYYLANNPDVAAAFGGDSYLTLQHFVNYGMKEGRAADGSFNVSYYKNANADLAQAFGNDLAQYYLHYMHYGESEGRVASNHVHSYTLISHTDATCTTEGVSVYQCDCGDEYTVTEPELGHSWVLISGNDSTVETLVYRCSVCGDEYSVPNPLYVSTSIACWGDSMTLGQYGDGVTYPDVLESLTGITTYNLGVSGETSIQIATRQGGIPMVLAEDVYLPRGGSTDFSLISTATGEEVYIDPIDDGYGDYSGYNGDGDALNLCYINGQAYEVTYNGYTHTLTDYYDADSDDPSTIYIPAGTQVYTKASVDRANDILILEIGSNQGWDQDYLTLVNQYAAMINSVGCDQYIILGDTDDPGDSADYSQGEMDAGDGLSDTAWEAALRSAFGDHFFNVRTYLIQNGLSDNGLTATQEDLDRASVGKISLQLRTSYDNTHLSAAGYYSKGIGVYLKGKELNYW